MDLKQTKVLLIKNADNWPDIIGVEAVNVIEGDKCIEIS